MKASTCISSGDVVIPSPPFIPPLRPPPFCHHWDWWRTATAGAIGLYFPDGGCRGTRGRSSGSTAGRGHRPSQAPRPKSGWYGRSRWAVDGYKERVGGIHMFCLAFLFVFACFSFIILLTKYLYEVRYYFSVFRKIRLLSVIRHAFIWVLLILRASDLSYVVCVAVGSRTARE